MMQRFATIEGWVFDLDNTLYPASQNLFAQIDKRMTAFIGEALAVERDEAYRLQKQFLGEYGTTLAGLMNKHGLPPGPFLDFVHDIDVSVLAPDPNLSEALAALPGKKFIFTKFAFSRIKIVELMMLSNHRSHVSHLGHEPLIYYIPIFSIIKLSTFFPKIYKYCS